MLLRVVACGVAAFLVIWPARSGIETDMLSHAPADAVAIAAPQEQAEPQNSAVNNATNKVEVPSEDKIAPVESEAGRQDHAQDYAAVEAQSDQQDRMPVQDHMPVEAQVDPKDRAPVEALSVQQNPTAVAATADLKDQASAELPAEQLNHAPTDSQAQKKLAALDPAEPAIASPPAADLFGRTTVRINDGNVITKWSGVEANIRADNKILARCRDDAASCPAAAKNFLAIVAQGRAQTGRARIGVINRAINLAIEPMSDLAQWGVPDRWSAPLETFTTGRGDCEDYAIAKYVALTAAGVAAEDVKLVIVRNTAAGEDHAVTAVRLDGKWIILDNRWLTLVADNQMAQAVPRFVLDSAGVRRFAAPAIAGTRHAAKLASL